MITKEQAIPGTKVKIPKTKQRTSEGTYEYFLKEVEAQGNPSYLLITDVYKYNVRLKFDTPEYTHLDLDMFCLDDLELYEEPVYKPVHVPFPFSDEKSPEELEEERQDTQFEPIRKAFATMEDLLRWKNSKYGNSALSADGIVATTTPLDKLLSRLDDKLQRWKNYRDAGHKEPRKEDVADVIGYCILILAERQWYDMEDQKQ